MTKCHNQDKMNLIISTSDVLLWSKCVIERTSVVCSGWWCWIKWRICCCSSGSCWWSVEWVSERERALHTLQTRIRSLTSRLFSGVLAFFFFSGRIPTPGTTFETAALNYYWMPIIVRFTHFHLSPKEFSPLRSINDPKAWNCRL